jgi:Xaa-Pro aminopeptidase
VTVARIFISNPSKGVIYETDFATLVSVIKGTSIINATNSDRFIELGLTEHFVVRIDNMEIGALRVNLVSTLSPNEISPARVQLVAEGEAPNAARVEQRLRNLRQVYAIIFLLNAGRADELASSLRKNPNTDLEDLVPQEERLYLEAAGPGTWWVSVFTRIKGAGQKALNTLSLIYGEGRELLLRRVRAETVGKEADAVIKGQKAEQEKIKTDQNRVKALADMLKTIRTVKNPDERAAIRDAFLKNTAAINPNISHILPPPNE